MNEIPIPPLLCTCLVWTMVHHLHDYSKVSKPKSIIKVNLLNAPLITDCFNNVCRCLDDLEVPSVALWALFAFPAEGANLVAPLSLSPLTALKNRSRFEFPCPQLTWNDPSRRDDQNWKQKQMHQIGVYFVYGGFLKIENSLKCFVYYYQWL